MKNEGDFIYFEGGDANNFLLCHEREAATQSATETRLSPPHLETHSAAMEMCSATQKVVHTARCVTGFGAAYIFRIAILLTSDRLERAMKRRQKWRRNARWQQNRVDEWRKRWQSAVESADLLLQRCLRADDVIEQAGYAGAWRLQRRSLQRGYAMTRLFADEVMIMQESRDCGESDIRLRECIGEQENTETGESGNGYGVTAETLSSAVQRLRRNVRQCTAYLLQSKQRTRRWRARALGLRRQAKKWRELWCGVQAWSGQLHTEYMLRLDAIADGGADAQTLLSNDGDDGNDGDDDSSMTF